MPAVLGIDISTHAVELALLDETTNIVDHHRVGLDGATAWERTLTIREALTGRISEEVYLVAIEKPIGQSYVLATLSPVLGAVAASLPPNLRVPHRCWTVHQKQWKTALGLTRKPTVSDIERLGVTFTDPRSLISQDARDAACIALYARDLNAEGIAA